jgi:triphosphoribosyl-dephospho-CoA synthase
MRSTLSKGLRASLACLLEVTARKPGNVHRFHDFPDLHFLDLATAALAIQEPMNRVSADTVGETILSAVQETRKLIRTNANLGIILLLAPLCAAPEDADPLSEVSVILHHLTVRDASLAYRAIRLADPGSLGEVDEQDVWTEPTVTLREAMCLAADRDDVARQYATDYADIRNLVLPVLLEQIARSESLEQAIVQSTLHVLAERPDSLITRKTSRETAERVSRQARKVLDGGSLLAFSEYLGHNTVLNPGTTADLMTAGLFLALSNGTIPLPREPGPRDESSSF